MIKTTLSFDKRWKQLERMYRALADLRENVMPKNPHMFTLMAEGPLEQIRQFQGEMESYVGVTQVEEHEGDLREIDLDDFSFTLRNVGNIPQIQCTFTVTPICWKQPRKRWIAVCE